MRSKIALVGKDRLQSLLNEVLENPEMNQHDTLITYCQEHFI